MRIQKNATSTSLNSFDPEIYGFIFHYFRAEVYRETSWRNRMDTTTNWAIVVTAAILSYSYSSAETSHVIILLSYLAVLFFLYVESRRYRYYNILRRRVRFLEKNLLASIFDDTLKQDNTHWKNLIAESLRSPQVTMSRLESIAWRIRRTYIFLIIVTMIAWIGRLMDSPNTPKTIQEFLDRASISILPGYLIFSLMVLSVLFLILIGYTIPGRSRLTDLP